MGPESFTLDHEDAEGRQWTTTHLRSSLGLGEPTPSTPRRTPREQQLHDAAKARRAKAKRGGKR